MDIQNHHHLRLEVTPMEFAELKQAIRSHKEKLTALRDKSRKPMRYHQRLLELCNVGNKINSAL